MDAPQATSIPAVTRLQDTVHQLITLIEQRRMDQAGDRDSLAPILEETANLEAQLDTATLTIPPEIQPIAAAEIRQHLAALQSLEQTAPDEFVRPSDRKDPLAASEPVNRLYNLLVLLSEDAPAVPVGAVYAAPGEAPGTPDPDAPGDSGPIADPGAQGDPGLVTESAFNKPSKVITAPLTKGRTLPMTVSEYGPQHTPRTEFDVGDSEKHHVALLEPSGGAWLQVLVDGKQVFCMKQGDFLRLQSQPHVVFGDKERHDLEVLNIGKPLSIRLDGVCILGKPIRDPLLYRLEIWLAIIFILLLRSLKLCRIGENFCMGILWLAFAAIVVVAADYVYYAFARLKSPQRPKFN